MTRAKGLKVYLRTWNFSVLKEKGPKVILTPGSVDVLVCIWSVALKSVDSNT